MTQDTTHMPIELWKKTNAQKDKVMIGEPSGTAGGAILNVLNKRKLTNILVVVTRYFGGILLGTGGLTKAYTESTILAIENAGEVEKEKGYIAEIVLEYDMQKEFEYICDKNDIKIHSKEYGEKIKNEIEISEEKYVELFRKNKMKSFQNIPIILKQNKFIEKS